MDLKDPQYAYMFGFLQADGHLAAGPGKKGKLTVEINVRDIEILQAFRRLTPYNSTITERTRATNFSQRHHSAVWTLSSLEARSRLNELGLPYGRKSLNVEPPTVPCSESDYLRGIIDADGSLGYTAQGLPFVGLTTASTALATNLCHFAQQLTGATRSLNRNARDRIYNIVYTKEAAVQLAGKLYPPGCLALSRKRAAATALAAWVRPPGMKVAPPRRRWTAEEDHILLNTECLAESMSRLDRSRSSCELRLWRLRTGRSSSPGTSHPQA
ncbi:hypothetical protein [Streptomyces sp. DW26H14]|uniref:hypothetical protein n=1 Tax=Streptomyces sp. DW26H14 TaxID=3435395 RepID=UPI00403E2F3C